jgi:cytochrome b561
VTVKIASYSGPAIALHWTVALLVLVVGVLGLLHDDWPRKTQAAWINIHALLGLLTWVLVMLRIGWRSQHKPPDMPDEVGAFSRRTATPVHLLLYFLLLTIPIVGIITFVWHGRVFNLGLFKVNFGVKSDRAIFHPTEDLHGYLAYALFALVAIHLLAALWHHFIRRDSVLQRMWPGLRQR